MVKGVKVTRVNHNTVRVAVSDTGYGIKEENVESIFAPFFTSKASTEGAGLGLHNAKGFILRHHGRIRAESEGEGKGAAFIPTLQNRGLQAADGVPTLQSERVGRDSAPQERKRKETAGFIFELPVIEDVKTQELEVKHGPI